MKKQFSFPTIAFIAILFFASCSKQFVGEGISNSPVQNFETLWQDFDQHYGAFGPKGIEWKALYTKYRPAITESMSDKALLDTMAHMLDVLNDNHIYIRPMANTGLPWYAGGILGRTVVEDYNHTVAQTYLHETFTYNRALHYGFFPGNIGYINLKSFDENISTYYKAMDVILDKLKDTKGIVIELRENDGGEDRVAQYIADRFATERHLSFSSSLRNGPRYTDFSEPILFYTQPEGSFQYTKPVILLTNLNTFSSGETFVLAMLQNKNVKMVGRTTGGALSDAWERELPNGWMYRLPIADVRDATGKNLEGIGIEPHVKIENTKEELKAGHDKALEKALDLLK
ncbi:MAG: S41 family peptidase [Flavisolibacter sp.]|nr:S41 family peptidase [Flavisolibacter sp.]